MSNVFSRSTRFVETLRIVLNHNDVSVSFCHSNACAIRGLRSRGSTNIVLATLQWIVYLANTSYFTVFTHLAHSDTNYMNNLV